MQRATVRPRRDGAALAFGYALLAVVFLGFGLWGLSTPAARGQQLVGHVWLTWFPGALWLAAAAVTGWRSRHGRLAPWLLVTVVLLAVWVILCLLVTFSSQASVGWYVVPQLVVGLVAAVLLALAIRVAGAARRGPVDPTVH